MLDHLAVLADEFDREFALAGEFEISGAILIAESVTADDDGLRPARHQARHIRADDRLADDDAAEDVADRAIRRFPHLLEIEFLHPRFIGRDGGAFDADAMLLDRICGIDGDLVLGLVAVLDGKIVILEQNIEIGMDELGLDQLPDDACHLIAIQLNHRICDLYFCHGTSLVML